MVKKSGLGSRGKPKKTYHQHNYVDVIKTITPDLYHDTDHSIYGLEDDISYAVLGKVLKAVDEVSSIVTVSGDQDLRSRFILRNNLTNIKPYLFEYKVLKPLGVGFDTFTSKADFTSYLSSVVLPNIHTNSPTTTFLDGVTTHVDSTITSLSGVHDYLVNNLSWVYFLNTSGPATGFDPSSQIATLLGDLYDNKPITETQSIQYLFEYLWRNREVSDFYKGFIPHQFNSTDATVSSDTYASGTQLLDGLKTLIGVWYNEKDESSTTLDTYLDLYLTTGEFSPKQVEGGAFTKFLQAVSYGFYDINSTIQDLEDLVDIERCPPQFLQYLASLIGWQLLTGDVDRWRAQLRKAVYLYKSKGTRRCLEDAVSLIFPGANLTVASDLEETWECFLPRMIYYLIATESAVLNDPSFGNNTAASAFKGISNEQFFVDNLDLNYRAATDYVLKVVHDNTPASDFAPKGGAIYINNKKFDLSSYDPTDPDFPGFYHRGKANVQVPPWENDRFYDNTFISDEQILILNDVLTGNRSDRGTNTPLGGLEIPTSYVGSLSSILKKEGLTDTLYDLNWNKKWKFHTSSMEVPPNLSSVIASGQSEKLNLLDFWSSKSSFAFTSISLNSIAHTIEGISLTSDTILKNIQNIFTHFAPFHVHIKLFAKEEMTDRYQVDEVLDSLCFKIDIPFYDATTSGDTDQVIMTNLVPSSVVVSGIGSAVGNGTGLSGYAHTPRTSGRRRSLRYSLNSPAFRRNGRGMPVATVFNSVSAIENIQTSAYGVHTTEFIPLGYNFSSGRYFSTSGDFSGIYDASNDLAMSGLSVDFSGTRTYLPNGRANLTDVEFEYSGIHVSSTFPCRAFYKHGNCEVARDRDTISKINAIIIKKLIEQGKTDDFSLSTINNFEFGARIHKDFYDSSGLFASSTMTPDNPLDPIPYSENEIKIIYSHFNSLVQGKQSRVHTRSEALYSTSGGARGYYIETAGGFTAASGGVADTASPYGSGVNYELLDD
tara:strand:- start:2788 stop:5775 length:2988 start_codon:yes stop_codon:yes gene_type:complete